MERSNPLMKRAPVFAGLILLLVFFPCAVSAQSRHPGSGMSSSCLPLGSISLERLDLAEEQRAAVQRIEKAYNDQINELHGRLMSKRLELQSVFRNPEADEQTIRARAREVFDLQDECRHMAMDYLVEIRGVLTPEQLRNWYTPADLCFPWNRRK
jgi:Spy/CpxP family protein refolding chaperone